MLKTMAVFMKFGIFVINMVVFLMKMNILLKRNMMKINRNFVKISKSLQLYYIYLKKIMTECAKFGRLLIISIDIIL